VMACQTYVYEVADPNDQFGVQRNVAPGAAFQSRDKHKMPYEALSHAVPVYRIGRGN
jgi:hypothetical protein